MVCVGRKAAAAKAERQGGPGKQRIVALEWEWVQIHASRPFSQAVDRGDSDECCLRLVIWSRFEVFLARTTSVPLRSVVFSSGPGVERPRPAGRANLSVEGYSFRDLNAGRLLHGLFA